MTWWKGLLGLLGAAALTGLVPAGRWLLERIEKEIDRRLERRQAERIEHLRKEHQRELQALQAMEARLASQFGAVTSLRLAAHSASAQKRVEAVDRLWLAVIALNRWFPAGIFLLDVVTDEEYPRARLHPNTVGAVAGITKLTLTKGMEPAHSADEVRPYVPPTLWFRYFAYRAFLGRIALRAIEEKTRLEPWSRDRATCDLLKSVLAPADYDRIMALPIGKLHAAQGAVQELILSDMRRLLSGELAATEAVESVQSMQQAILKAEIATDHDGGSSSQEKR
jgi:hypothetical protein